MKYSLLLIVFFIPIQIFSKEESWNFRIGLMYNFYNTNFETDLSQNKTVLDILYDKYQGNTLRQMCKENQLTQRGNKRELITRLLKNKVLNPPNTEMSQSAPVKSI